MKRLLATAIVLFLLVAAPPARTNPFETFGADGQSIAMGSAGAALADDFSALFSGPASMVHGPSAVGASLILGFNELQARLSPRPVGYDPPDLGVASPVIPYRYRLRARHDPPGPPNVYGAMVGFTTGLGLDWLRVGALFYIPLSGFGDQVTHFSDEREQYFSNTIYHELYGARLVGQQVMFGAAVQPFSWFSIGLGARVQPASRSDSEVLITNPVDLSQQEINLKVDTGLNMALIASLAFSLYDDSVRLGVTFRDRSEFTIKGAAEVQVSGFQDSGEYPFSQPMRFTLGYSPRQISLAGAFRQPDWHLAADLTWSNWSAYRDNHGAAAGFDDTLNAAIGAGYSPYEHLWVRGGFGYRTTPVPTQTGRTNYVDNDMVVLGLGLGYDWLIDGKLLTAQLFQQFQIAVPRTTEKRRRGAHPPCDVGAASLCDEVRDDLTDPQTGERIAAAAGLQTGNPGFPGFSSGGFVSISGVQLVWRY